MTIYDELMGEPDDFDTFFIIGEDEHDLIVMRVMGRPELDMEWVH